MSTRTISLDVTESQYNAITFPLDPGKILKVVAGPGAGKTRTLVNKIAYALGQGVKPDEILALSLTNRAVYALRDQLTELVGSETASLVNIITFHAYSISVVSAHYSSDWQLLEDVGWKTLSSIMHNPKGKTPRKARRLSRNEMENLINLANSGTPDHRISELMKGRATPEEVRLLMNWIHHSKIVTYKDLLKTATRMLRKDPGIAGHVKMVIVDEFQDMYGDLLELVKVLAKDKHLVIAGDPNQSIFGFLGSRPQIVDDFDKDMEGKQTSVITLSECFRSTPEIIGVADAIVKAVVPRIHVKEPGHLPIFKVFDSDLEEYAFLVSEVKRILSMSNGLVKPTDIAILGRTNKKIDAIRDYLEGEGIETVKLASVQTWIDSPIYHFVDYLEILHDPHRADHSLMSTMALLDNVGSTTLRNIMIEVADANSKLSAIDQISIWGYLNAKRSPKFDKLFANYINTIKETKQLFDESAQTPDNLMKFLLELSSALGLKKRVSKSLRSPQDSIKFQDYLRKFYESLCASAEMKGHDQQLVEYFLKHYNDVPILRRDDAVNLSTVHSAKGLEFPITFILAKEETFGHQFVNNDEERRTLYVAITRASALLYYDKLAGNYHGTKMFIDHKDLSKYFTLENPTLDPPFWSKYATSLGVQHQVRAYHTHRSLLPFSNSLWRSARFGRKLFIK